LIDQLHNQLPDYQITQLPNSGDIMSKIATRSVDLEPIDRLEEKVRRLIGMVDRMKAEQTRAAEENQRLSRELAAAIARASASDGLVAELSALKEERDVIRTRVTDMLDQLEALNL
jgi:FtsZ-binding cell division protein ZapB